MRPVSPGTPIWRLNPVTAASEFRHVAASGSGRFQRDRSGDADIQGIKIDKNKADLLEGALRTRGIADQEAFSERLRRHGDGLRDRERDLLIDLATNWFETTTDKEFEVIATNSLEMLGNRSPGENTHAATKRGAPASQRPAEPKERGVSSAQSAPAGPNRLQAELDAASRNRRAAVERAARKEAEFHVERETSNAAWKRVQKEAAKAGIQVGHILLTGKGRAAPPALAAAVDAYNQAMADAARQQEELTALRNDIAEWDNVIREILARMSGTSPTR